MDDPMTHMDDPTTRRRVAERSYWLGGSSCCAMLRVPDAAIETSSRPCGRSFLDSMGAFDAIDASGSSGDWSILNRVGSIFLTHGSLRHAFRWQTSSSSGLTRGAAELPGEGKRP